MDLRLDGKVAVITGSSRGLGLASARALVGEGTRVCICARGAEQLGEAVAELRAESGSDDAVIGVEADLNTASGVDSVIDRAVAIYGGIDILVNNVGKAGGGDLLETTDPDGRRRSTPRCIRRSAPHGVRCPTCGARGAASSSSSPRSGAAESGGRMTYNAVKAAEISLAKSLAGQLAKDNIRVNSVAPGSISFPGGSWALRQAQDPEGIAAFIERELPFGRVGRAEEVGDVVAFLASPRTSWISGRSITVDGGQSRSLF